MRRAAVAASAAADQCGDGKPSWRLQHKQAGGQDFGAKRCMNDLGARVGAGTRSEHGPGCVLDEGQLPRRKVQCLVGWALRQQNSGSGDSTWPMDSGGSAYLYLDGSQRKKAGAHAQELPGRKSAATQLRDVVVHSVRGRTGAVQCGMDADQRGKESGSACSIHS